MSRHTQSILEHVEHRPWPLPDAPWIMYQSWRRLLFAHWPVPRESLRGLVPPELEVETFDGSGWVGLTPFRIMDLRPRGVPAIVVVSEFPEMNLRTYVRAGSRPGIFFFSLDAGSRLAVLGARMLYRLPYFTAEMSQEQREDWIEYRSRRTEDPPARFEGRYRPEGEAFQARPGTLEHFLTERYALYTGLRDGTILRGDIHHRPWPLRRARAEIDVQTVTAAHGIELPARDPVLHYAERQDTLIWAPARVGSDGT